jgi:alanine racemase
MGYITLDKKAFFHNANYYANLLKDKNKICISLKDNAYGHGIQPIANLCKQYGIKHCMVRTIQEANLLAPYDFESILILYDIPIQTYPENFIFSINSLDDIPQYAKNSKVELKIDTGMSRNGISDCQYHKALDILDKHNLILNGVFTHFHSANEDKKSVNLQEKLFLQVVEKIRLQTTKSFRIHCSNTNSIDKIDIKQYDIARLGIGLYGYNQNPKTKLLPVLALWANKISSRTLHKGDTIGYGAKYQIENNNTIVSNYNIGYGDGFFRIDESKKVYIKNQKQILGIVSMDSLSVLGDEQIICIFDNVTNLSQIHNTIEYEILTHLMPHIKRDIINI